MKGQKHAYICSPFRPISTDPILRANELIDNLKLAKDACTFATLRGCEPIAPHLFYPQFLDDNDPTERALGMELGLKALRSCDELWIISAARTAAFADVAVIHRSRRAGANTGRTAHIERICCRKRVCQGGQGGRRCGI